MSFTGPYYILFFAAAAGGWYCFPQRLRRFWLLAAGIAFYCFAGLRFLPVLLGAALVSYFAALATERRWLGKRRLWTCLGLLCILGALFACKYLTFFCGIVAPGAVTRGLPLPPGLSFYSFGACAYLIDVQRGKLRAERDPVDYAAIPVIFSDNEEKAVLDLSEFLNPAIAYVEENSDAGSAEQQKYLRTLNPALQNKDTAVYLTQIEMSIQQDIKDGSVTREVISQFDLRGVVLSKGQN